MNNLFAKATALVMSSMMAFSGQALAISSNNREVTDADALGNSKSVIAQATGVSPSGGVSVGVAVAIAVRALGQAVTVVRTAAVNRQIPPELASVVLPRLSQAQRALASAQGSAQVGNYSEVSRAVGVAISVLGQTAQALGTASTPSTQAIAQVIATASQALALAQGQATSPSP